MDVPWAAAVETHTAAVFFAGDHVFKVKKPVRLDFVDLATRQARQAACASEVTLNRRLAPDVYLGVADITIGGEMVEHAVVMRRLPAEASLTARIVADDPHLASRVIEVAQLLGAFHARCPVVGADLPVELWTSPIELFRIEVERTARLTATDECAGRALAQVRVLADAYAAGRAELFRARLEGGLVRDGHGDLQAADIYLLEDGPRVLDCLEFDQRLRVGDVLHDVAFLAMDLERLGRPELGALLLDRYCAVAAETHPATLAHYFVAHRALVRAKVAAIRREQLGKQEDSSVSGLLALTKRHLEAAQVRVILLGGLPGSGKTTVASALSEQLPAVHLNSDQVRHELTAPSTPGCGFETGRYAPAVSDEVYAELLRRAEAAVTAGEHVILDASWRAARHRAAARRLAADLNAVPVELLASVDDATASVRLLTRRSGEGGSEATVEVRERMRRRFDPWPQSTRLDTSRPRDATLLAATGAISVAVGGFR